MFDITKINKDVSVLIVKGLDGESPKKVRDTLINMREMTRVPVVAVGEGVTVDSMSDDDLRKIGLQRIPEEQ